MARRWEHDETPLLARLGAQRPDEDPALVEHDVRLVGGVLDARYATRHPGTRELAMYVFVPAVAAQYSCVYLSPPESGAFLRAITCSTAAAVTFGTENDAGTFPALNPVGGVELRTTFRPDNREPAPVLSAAAGSNAGPNIWHLVSNGLIRFPGPSFWVGTRLGICPQTVLTLLECVVYYSVPLVGARQ